MKDYPDKMTPEQVRTFRDDVLSIVSQIPRGHYDIHLKQHSYPAIVLLIKKVAQPLVGFISGRC